MVQVSSTQTVKPKKRLLVYVFVLLVVALGCVGLLLELTNTTHFFHKSAKISAPSKPISHLPAKPATTKKLSARGSDEKGGPTDTNGQLPTSTSTDPGQWAKSASGLIVLKTPRADTEIKSGISVAGSASVAQVQYRLIDNQTGVISEGPINVVAGNFSAKIAFEAYNNTGRLDVFSTEANGKEVNEIQIMVKF